MAIAVDSAQGRANGSGTSVSLTCGTVASGALVLAAISMETDNRTVSSVAFGVTSMTQLGSNYDLGDGQREMTLWYCFAPSGSTGTAITATASGSTVWQVAAVSYTGVDTTTPFTTADAYTVDTSSPAAFTSTSNLDGSWHVAFLQSSNASIAITSGGVGRQKQNSGASEAAYIYDSNTTVANTATNTMNLTFAAGRCGGIGAMMRPAAAATVVKDMLGQGQIAFPR